MNKCSGQAGSICEIDQKYKNVLPCYNIQVLWQYFGTKSDLTVIPPESLLCKVFPSIEDN